MESHLRQALDLNKRTDDTILQENRAYTERSVGDYSPLVRAQHSTPPANSLAPSTDQFPTTQARSNPIAIARLPPEEVNDTIGFEGGDDDDDDDDAGMDVVERDARQLRKKYGSSVIAASSSYRAGMTEESSSIPSRSLLKAPYLGSLSKSESRLQSLPPISLTDESTIYNYDEEPQTEITSYGSLRESHQRGKFLDGPSSYREPCSGQVRRLDRHRFPVGLSKSHQPTISIAERIQQNQKRNSNLKQKTDGTNNDVTEKSGLAILLAKASADPASQDGREAIVRQETFKLPTNNVTGEFSQHLSVFGGEEDEAYDKFDPPTMMSTSMTAFEVLHNASHQRNVPKPQNHEHSFQPLARSMSDPTPNLQRSPMLSPGSIQLNSPVGNEVGSLPLTAISAERGAPPIWQASPFMTSMVGGDASLLPNTRVSPFSPYEAHDPDTDAAFDMEME